MIGWILAAVLYVIGAFMMVMMKPDEAVSRWWLPFFWPVIIPAALIVGLVER